MNFRWCYQNKVKPEALEIPLFLIMKIDKSYDKNLHILCISTKDGRSIKLGFTNEIQHEYNIFSIIHSYAFPQTIISRFALKHKVEGQEDGWNLYDPHIECKRLGINVNSSSCNWKFLDNSNWEYCDTYPETIIVPKALSKFQIRNCAGFRKKNRLPALVWSSPHKGTSLWRASQPKAGIRTSRCLEDENYLRVIAEASPKEPLLYIFDARPYINAQAQRVLGGGVENKFNYELTELQHLSICNIHAVRESWQTLMVTGNSVPGSKYFSTVEKSSWIEYLATLLSGASSIVEGLMSGVNCLVHCSDGWDRTTQLCSIAEILLDSHYRTVRGFCQLVEKEWVQFGHQFDVRLGNANSNPNDENRSPIFLQFLDCVYQLTQQFPTHFEFNSQLLEDISYFAYSGRFGTFMCNSQKERHNLNLQARSTSVWTHVLDNLDRYMSPYYQVGQEDLITPCCSPKILTVWKEVFLKWSSEFYYSGGEFNSADQHKEVLMKSANEGMNLFKTIISQKEKEIQNLKKQLDELQGYEFPDNS